MKTHLLRFLLLSSLFCLFDKAGFGQEYYDNTNNPRQYYYNNLESATAGTPSTFLPAANSTRSAAANIDIVSSSSLNSSKSFSTIGSSSIGYIQWNFNGTGSISMSSIVYEWEFDYKNVTGVAPNDPNTMTGGTDSWRYWLIANAYSGNNTTGLYVTQSGNKLILRTKYLSSGVISNTDYANITLPVNTDTYQIRIVKNGQGYYYVYILDRTTSTTTQNGPYNIGTTVGTPTVDLNTYYNSYLEATSAASNRFQWDNFNFYQQKVDYVGITSTSNGISAYVYPGIVNAIPFGVNVNIRGDIIFGLITFASANNGQSLFTGGSLYKTTNSVLSISTGTSLVGSVNIYSTGTNEIPLPSSEYYYNPGNTNGTTANVINYFLVAQGRNPFYFGYPANITYTVSTAGADNYQSFYQTSTNGYAFPFNNSSESTGAVVPTALGPPPTISYTSPQTYTVGTAITTLTPTVTNSPTSYSTTGLPAGLTLNTANGQITGTPTAVSAATNYSVTANNSYGSATATINITVNSPAPPTISYPTPQVYTVGVAIATLTPTVTNNPTSYSTTGLPAGLSLNTGTGQITGTPTSASAATNYSVTASNGSSATATINITVNAKPVLSYTSPQTYYVGTTITTLSPANSGGAIGSYGTATNFGSVSNADAVALDASNNVYTFSTNAIYAFNSAGTAITNAYTSATATYSNVQATIFDGAGNLYVSNNGSNIVTRISSAGTVTNITVNTPNGLTADASNNIYVASGNGTIYKIASGATTATAFLTGFSSPYGVAINSSGDLYVGQGSDNTIYKIANGTSTHVSFATGFNSPRSIVFDPSGNLTIADAYNNVVKKITPGGIVTTVITSGLSTPTGEAYDASGNLYVANFYLGTLEKYAGTYYSVSPALPTGLTFNTYSGNITGTPTAVTAAANYTVTGYYGSASTVTTVINITVNPAAPVIAYTTPQTYYVGVAIAALTPSNSGGTIASASSSPTLPAGLSISSTGVITGTPTTASAATTYTITATNAGGSGTAPLSITVVAAPAINYTTPQVYYVGTTISPLSPTNSGGVVGSYGTPSNLLTVANSNGIAVSPSTGQIYITSSSGGTAAVYSSTGTLIHSQNGYTTSPYGPAGIMVDASGSYYFANRGAGTVIKTGPAPTYTQTTITGFTEPTALATDVAGNIYVVDRGAGNVYKFAPGATTAGTAYITGLSQPWGIAINSSGDIYVSEPGPTNTINTIFKYPSGSTTPTTIVSSGLNSPRDMTIDAAGNIYEADAGSGNINLISPAGAVTTLLSGLDSPIGVALDASGNLFATGYNYGEIYKSVAGGYSISATLPAGLYFNNYTGVISGTPTAVSAATNYTVTATNGAGSSNKVVNITVTNPTAPTAANVSNCGDGTFTLTASGSVPSGGTYNWYNASTGGTLLATGATYSPNVVTTTTYYVSYTSGTYTTSRTAVTATVYPIVSSPLTSQFFAYPFSAGSTNDISGNGDNGILKYVSPSAANATTSADRYGNANSAYTFDGKGQNIYTITPVSSSSGPNTFTLSLWFNTTTTSGGKLIGYENTLGGGGQFDRHIYMDNGGYLYYGVYVGGTKTISSAVAYNDGRWHHVVVTMSPANGAIMYVDDVKVAFDATITSGEPHAGYWLAGGGQLGGWPSTNGITSTYFAGQIDDIGVYSTEQTAAQVAAADNLNLIGTTAVSVCAGSPISFTAQTITGATYTWTDPGGNTQTGQNPTFASAIVGTYTLSVTGGPGGCTSTASITPTINAAPSATFTATSSVVTGANATVTFTGTYNAAYTYSWNFNGGSPATGAGQGPFSVSWSTAGTKTITLTVTNPATGCVAIATQTVTVSGSYNTYSYSLPLTINSTSLGITTDQTNFPFLLTVTDPSLVITSGGCSNKVQYPTGNGSGYYDMAFVVSGTEIPYQIESYNTTTGTLLVWVKLPTLSHTANSTVTFYFGSGTANSGNNYNSVWSNVVAASGTSYNGVWHFNETPSTSSATLTDATGNGNGLTSFSAANVTQNTASLISNGITLNGSNVFKASVNFASLALTSSLSMSTWVYYTTPPSGNSNPMVLTSSTGYDQMEFRSPGNYIGMYGSGGSTTVAGTTVPATGAWHYLVYTYNGTTNNFYIDGALNATSTTTPNTGTITNVFFGSYGNGQGEYYYGNIDESRVVAAPLTADWIKAEYNNQSNPASYTSSGTLTTYFANASLLKGGITYSTADGVNYNYTINSTTTSAAPPTTGTANIVVTGASAALSAALTIYQLTVNTSDQIDLNGQTMSVGCNIFNNGTITNSSATAASLTFNGSASTQTYTAGSSSNTATVDNLIVNNTAPGTITMAGGPVNVTNILTMTQGNLAISAATGTAFTLKSNATKTASVAQLGSGCTITGTVNVERYIAGGTSHRGYRFFSGPVNQGSNAGLLSGHPYYGFKDLQSTTIVTGYGAVGTAYTSATQPTDGFDPSAQNNPSVFFYNEPSFDPVNTAIHNSDYRGIKTIDDVLPVGNGFLFFFRGSRSVLDGNNVNKATTAAVPENTTLKYTGNLNQGTINVYIPKNAIVYGGRDSVYQTPATASSTFTYSNHTQNGGLNNGFQLVGNPYASAIDLESITLTNPYNKFIYMLNDAGTLGFYTIGSNTSYTSSNSLTGNLHNNGVGRYVMPGQGFFIKANTPTGTTSLTFAETCKVPMTTVTSYGTPTLFQFSGPKNLAALTAGGVPVTNAALAGSGKQTQMIHIMLALDSLNSNEAVIRFGEAGASNKFNGHEDAYYAYGLSQTTFMATYSSDSQPLLFNEMGSLDSIKSIPLYAEGQTSGVYKMAFSGAASVDPRYKLYLKDNLLKDSLDLSANSVYTFNIDRTNTQTYGSNRFTLVVSPTNIANYYNLSEFTGVKQTGGDLISWKTQYEGNYTGFVLQRSTDGFKTFTVLDSVQSTGAGGYSFLDTKPYMGVNQYRLVQNNINNVNSYSGIVTISYQPINAITDKFQIYPNPAVSVINLNVKLVNNPSTIFAKVYSTNGMLLINAKFSSTSALSQDVSKLIKGTYVIKVTDSNNKDYGTALFTKL